MFSFLFGHKINTVYLKLSQIAYGGEFYYSLRNYKLKSIDTYDTQFSKVNDSLLKKIGNNSFYSFKNDRTGFVVTLFENIKNNEIVIAYRGTERVGLGENSSNLIALGKDIQTDLNIILGEMDEQFSDAYDFYNLVKKQNPKAKIILVGQSLGGALAQLVAAKVYSNTKQKIKTFTYNAPGCKHLLKTFGCKEHLNYSFVNNYAVMNDWCGMFAENIGQTFLLPPISFCTSEKKSLAELFENALLATHEGIFDCSGRVIRKPKNFNQAEGLSLWYFDVNNPIKDFEKPSDLIASVLPSFELPNHVDNIAEAVQNKWQGFVKNQSTKFQEITAQIQTATNEFIETQKDKIVEGLSNTTINQISTFLDDTFADITVDSLVVALSVMKKMKIHKTYSNYYNSFERYLR